MLDRAGPKLLEQLSFKPPALDEFMTSQDMMERGPHHNMTYDIQQTRPTLAAPDSKGKHMTLIEFIASQDIQQDHVDQILNMDLRILNLEPEDVSHDTQQRGPTHNTSDNKEKITHKGGGSRSMLHDTPDGGMTPTDI